MLAVQRCCWCCGRWISACCTRPHAQWRLSALPGVCRAASLGGWQAAAALGAGCTTDRPTDRCGVALRRQQQQRRLRRRRITTVVLLLLLAAGAIAAAARTNRDEMKRLLVLQGKCMMMLLRRCPIIGSTPRKSSPADNLPAKIRHREGRIFTSKLSSGGDFSGNRSYNGDTFYGAGHILIRERHVNSVIIFPRVDFSRGIHFNVTPVPVHSTISIDDAAAAAAVSTLFDCCLS